MGIEISKNEIITFLDDDTVLEKNYFEEILKVQSKKEEPNTKELKKEEIKKQELKKEEPNSNSGAQNDGECFGMLTLNEINQLK